MATTLNFSKLFGKHPFKPMKRHMKLAAECAACMPEVVDAFLLKDDVRLRAAKERVGLLERDADAIYAEIQDRLPSSIFTPVARRDLLDVLDMQEAIADRAEDIAGMLADLPLEVPGDIHEPMRRLAASCVTATNGAREIVKLIDLLLHTNFKGPNVELMKQQIQDVLVMETDTDAICYEITHALFAHRDDLDALSIVFLYKVVGWLDDLADFSEQLAVRSRILLAS